MNEVLSHPIFTFLCSFSSASAMYMLVGRKKKVVSGCSSDKERLEGISRGLYNLELTFKTEIGDLKVDIEHRLTALESELTAQRK